MLRLIKSIFILIGLKIRNLIKKPVFVKKDGKDYINIGAYYKTCNRKGRRALTKWVKRNPHRIVNL